MDFYILIKDYIFDTWKQEETALETTIHSPHLILKSLVRD